MIMDNLSNRKFKFRTKIIYLQLRPLMGQNGRHFTIVNLELIT